MTITSIRTVVHVQVWDSTVKVSTGYDGAISVRPHTPSNRLDALTKAQLLVDVLSDEGELVELDILN